MAMNPMQQQMSPDMLMAMMTDPRASPQQRMAAMSALNTMKGGANAPAPPPQMTGDSTGVSTINPAFMAAVRQEVMGQGPEAQPEIPQRQAAPEAPQDSTTQALMSGAADASRVAAMARGGEVKGYANGEEVTGGYGKKYTYGPLSVGPFYPQNLPFGVGKLFDDNQDPNEEVDLLALHNASKDERRESLENARESNIQGIREQLLDPNLSDAKKLYLKAQLSVLEQSSKADLRRRTVIPPSFKNTDLYQYFVPQSEKREINRDRAAAVTEQQRLRGELPEPLNLPALDALKAAPPFQDYGVGTPYEKPITLNTPDFFNAPARRAEAAAAAQMPAASPAPPPAVDQAPAPAVDPAVEAMNAQRQSESDAYKKRMEELLSGDQPLSSQDKYMALLKAGLGTMASASKPGATFLGSIGEGGMSGVQSLDELRKERAVNRMKQATLLQAQRSEDLSNEARNRQLDISAGGLEVARAKEIRDAAAEAADGPTDRAYKKALTQAALRQAASAGETSDAFTRRVDAYRIAMPGATEEEILDRAAGYNSQRPNQYTIDKDALSFAQRDPVVKALAESPESLTPTPEFTKKLEDATEAARLRYIKQTGGSGAETAPPPKLTPDQQANYDAAKKAIESGKDRNAVLERLRASGTPTTGL